MFCVSSTITINVTLQRVKLILQLFRSQITKIYEFSNYAFGKIFIFSCIKEYVFAMSKSFLFFINDPNCPGRRQL